MGSRPFRIFLALCAVAGSARPALAAVQGQFDPIAFVQYEFSANELSGGSKAFTSNLVRISAGFESNLRLSLQEFYLDAAYGKVAYGDLERFGTDEYAVRAGMKWAVGRNFDGILDATDRKQVPSVPDLLITGNYIERERRLTAALNVQVGEHWRLETAAISRELETPIEELTNFGLDQEILLGAFRYLTPANLSYGVAYESIDGKYVNAPELATYTQHTPGIILNYGVQELQTLQITVGQTTRDQTNEAEPFVEITGSLNYKRTLTGNTALFIELRRQIDNYFGRDAGAFGLVESWKAGLAWKYGDKYALLVDFTQTRTEFLGDGIAGQVVTGRKDLDSAFNIKLAHSTRPWLLSEFYMRLDRLTSNIDRVGFDGLLIGVRFAARRPD